MAQRIEGLASQPMDGPTPDNFGRAVASGESQEVCQRCFGVLARLSIQCLASPHPVRQSSVCSHACVGNGQWTIDIAVGIVTQLCFGFFSNQGLDVYELLVNQQNAACCPMAVQSCLAVANGQVIKRLQWSVRVVAHP